MEISVIVPVYNEEENINLFFEKLNSELLKLNKSYEIIAVNDGSVDKTIELLREKCKIYPELKVISLFKNYGQTAAIVAGLDKSKGDVIVLIDSDLQNDPEDIGELLKKIDKGYDIVSGWRKNRKDPYFTKILPSMIANKIISFFTKVKIHDFGCTLKAYKRQFLNPAKIYGEMHRFLPIYGINDGAKICEIVVQHHPRKFGKSKYGLIRSFKVVLDLITIKFLSKYFNCPMYFFGGYGLLFMFVSIVSGIYTLYARFYTKIAGLYLLPLVLLTMFFLIMSLNFILMGILAEMLTRVYYKQNEKNSIYLIKEEFNG